MTRVVVFGRLCSHFDLEGTSAGRICSSSYYWSTWVRKQQQQQCDSNVHSLSAHLLPLLIFLSVFLISSKHCNLFWEITFPSDSAMQLKGGGAFLWQSEDFSCKNFWWTAATLHANEGISFNVGKCLNNFFQKCLSAFFSLKISQLKMLFDEQKLANINVLVYLPLTDTTSCSDSFSYLYGSFREQLDFLFISFRFWTTVNSRITEGSLVTLFSLQQTN